MSLLSKEDDGYYNITSIAELISLNNNSEINREKLIRNIIGVLEFFHKYGNTFRSLHINEDNCYVKVESEGNEIKVNIKTDN